MPLCDALNGARRVLAVCLRGQEVGLYVVACRRCSDPACLCRLRPQPNYTWEMACQLDVAGMNPHMELGGMEDALCAVSTTTGLYPSDDALLTSFGLAEPSGDSASSQFGMGLESSPGGSASHSYQQLCLLETSAAQGAMPAMDGCQMLDVTGMVDPSVSGAQGLSDVVDFTPIRIKEACDEAQLGEGQSLLGGSPKDAVMGHEAMQGAGMQVPQVLYGVPMDNMMPGSEGNRTMMSDPLNDPNGIMMASMGMSMGMEAAYKASAGLLEPSLTNGKMMWAAAKNEPGQESGSVGSGSKTRWKPNSQQLCLLEQHFKSGGADFWYLSLVKSLTCTVRTKGYRSMLCCPMRPLLPSPKHHFLM